jgi:hypothetical protein
VHANHRGRSILNVRHFGGCNSVQKKGKKMYSRNTVPAHVESGTQNVRCPSLDSMIALDATVALENHVKCHGDTGILEQR